VAYVLPAFNLSVGIWRDPHLPPLLPDLVIRGNLSPGEIGSMHDPVAVGAGQPLRFVLMWLRCPPLSDLRPFSLTPSADLVEVPLGSGRFYFVFDVDDVGKGFPNEHRFALLAKGGPTWPFPIP
jgi:hypothetical protein